MTFNENVNKSFEKSFNRIKITYTGDPKSLYLII